MIAVLWGQITFVAPIAPQRFAARAHRGLKPKALNLHGPTCPGPSQLENGATPPPYATAYHDDPDGNIALSVNHHGCPNEAGGCVANSPAPTDCNNVQVTTGTTCNFYDGLDRLVEVKLPQAGSDLYQNPWITRYSYDLTGAAQTFHGQSFVAYGNLFATQELVGPTPAPSVTGDPSPAPASVANQSFIKLKAYAYDGVDRLITAYAGMGAGTGSSSYSTESYTWDSSPLDPNIAGYLGEICNSAAPAQCQEYDYDADGEEQAFASAGGPSPEPGRQYTYDADGRPANITQSGYSAQQYSYNADGALVTSVDAAQHSQDVATLTYSLYPDDTREYVSVASTVLTQSDLFSYSYRGDGPLKTYVINDGSVVPQVAHPGSTQLAYVYTPAGRLSSRKWTGSAEGTLMTTGSQGWDTNNDLVSTTDANGNTTQYAYDTAGYNQGNVVEVLGPQVTDVYQHSSVQPLSTYSYDQFNNLTAYCDPDYNLNYGNQWTNSPTDTLCGKSGPQYFAAAFTQSTNEPYGCLTTITKPMQYATDISYGTSGDQCGNGLPRTAAGAVAISQWNGKSRTPTQHFTYDGYGNLTNYDRGTDASGNLLDSWTLDYDNDNRNDWKQQNDALLPGSTAMYSYTCLYPDGSVFYTETPSQHAADGNQNCPSIATLLASPITPPPPYATSYQYDLDGDQIEMITHKGCSTTTPCPNPSSQTACASGQSNPIGTTCKYYDGLDRLVETAEPYDSGRTLPDPRPGNSSQFYEFYTFRWMNRYIYDLSQSDGSAQLSISDQTGTTSSFAGYGNLYKTQEYLPQAQSNMQVGLSNRSQGQYTGSPAWSDVRGTSFDGLDRPISKYELAYGTAAVTTNAYDTPNQLDLLGSTQNAVGQITTYRYDYLKRAKTIAFSGTQPRADTRYYTFDADGRTITIQNTMGTLIYQYDWDGNKVSVQEPSASGNPSRWVPSLICWQYYPDDLREYVSVAPQSETTSCSGNITYETVTNGISQPNLLSYAYTHDGRLNDEIATWGTNSEKFTWTHSDSGRELTETDPLTGEAVGATTFQQASYSYDTYGRVYQLNLPEGWEESSLAYDQDDELTGYQASAGGSGVTRALYLNARGELLEDELPSVKYFLYAQGPTYSANGTQVGNGNCYPCSAPQPDIFSPPSTLTFDERSGMAIYGTNPYMSLYDTYGAGDGFGEGAYGYSYDAAGRQTTTTQYPNYFGSNPLSSPTPAYSTSYDTENHVSSTGNIADLKPNANPQASSATAIYGPDGHQALTTVQNGTTDNRAVHWDGDTILFVADPNDDNTIQLYIDQLGTLDNSGNVDVIDRDQTGSGQTIHGSIPAVGGYWFSNWSLGMVRSSSVYIKGQNGGQMTFSLFPGSCGNPNQGYCGENPLFPMTRPDGYAMVGGIVQGARTYDVNSGQWLTPDAYVGDVRDSMTQKPFIWNNNNPVEWSDPSGFDAIQLLARPVWSDAREALAGNPQHLYVHIEIDKRGKQQGGTSNITFGPVGGGLPKVGLAPSGSEGGANTTKRETLCSGNCTSQAAAMQTAAKQIDQLGPNVQRQEAHTPAVTDITRTRRSLTRD